MNANNTTKNKHKLSYSEKIQISISIVTLLVTILAFCISLSSLKIAGSSYEYATADFTLTPKVEKIGNKMMVSNPDIELFEITGISVNGYERWRIYGEESSDTLMFNIFTYNQNISDENRPNLNEVNIDLNYVYQSEGEISISEDEQQKFETAYNVNIANLQGKAEMQFRDKIYEIDVEYTNKNSYHRDVAELNVILDGNGNVEKITIAEHLSHRHTSFYLADNYKDFSSVWKDVVTHVESLSQRPAWVPYEQE